MNTRTGHRVESELSVVIPTLGRPILRRCLESLRDGDIRPACVIVVDQGRSTEVAAMLAEFGTCGLAVRYEPSTRTGRAAGVNRGIMLARTEWVAVTDDDCVPAPDWIARMAARLREHPESIVTGRVDAMEGDVVLSVVTSDVLAIQRRPALRFDRLSGGNMAMPAALIGHIGGFDEDQCVRTAEDAEFSYRALRAGVPIVYAPDVGVCHLGWRDAVQRKDQYRGYALSHGGFFGKYLRRRDAFIALRAVILLLRSVRRWARGAVRRDPEMASFGRAYVLGLVPGILAGWRSHAP